MIFFKKILFILIICCTIFGRCSENYKVTDQKKFVCCSPNVDKTKTKEENDERRNEMEMFMDEHFQKIFKQTIENKNSWNVSISTKLLNETASNDFKLYEDPSLFLIRRKAARRLSDPKTWPQLVYKACWEIASGNEGELVNKFREIGFYNSLYDYVQHVNDFEIIKKAMEERGEQVYVFGYNYSAIHDVDKLHPIMLTAYAEKFDDKKDTQLWQSCVQNHIDVNPHHQGNSIWREANNCQDIALPEMVCDKVSRRLQKNLRGKMSEEVWDVDRKYFDGLPSIWLNKALTILEDMKKYKRS